MGVKEIKTEKARSRDRADVEQRKGEETQSHFLNRQIIANAAMLPSSV
jgi:hypothetical protein